MSAHPQSYHLSGPPLDRILAIMAAVASLVVVAGTTKGRVRRGGEILAGSLSPPTPSLSTSHPITRGRRPPPASTRDLSRAFAMLLAERDRRARHGAEREGSALSKLIPWFPAFPPVVPGHTTHLFLYYIAGLPHVGFMMLISYRGLVCAIPPLYYAKRAALSRVRKASRPPCLTCFIAYHR